MFKLCIYSYMILGIPLEFFKETVIFVDNPEIFVP